MRFGGRVERVAFIQFRGRFLRRYTLDPRRLLGSIVKLRFEHIRGARLFYQCTLHLDQEEETARAMLAMGEGLKVSGYRLGGAAVGDFLFFMGKVDKKTLETVVEKHLPEFNWDHRVESRYLTDNWYGKLDLKLASIQRRRTALDDKWQYTDMGLGQSISGTMGKLSYQAQERLWTNRDKRLFKVHFLSSRGRNEVIPLSSFVEIFASRKETRTTRRELEAFMRQTRATIGDDLLEEAGFPGVLPQRDSYHSMRYNLHLVLEREALNLLADRILSAREMPKGSPLRRLARRHPYQFWRFRRAALKGEAEQDRRLAHLLLSMLSWRNPAHSLLTDLSPMTYLFDWSISTSSLPRLQGICGGCAVPEELRLAWRTWEALADFDELYEDLDLEER